MNLPTEIVIPLYWLNGGEMIEREALPAEHPEHTYNYIKRIYKVDPERYGVKKPENKVQ